MEKNWGQPGIEPGTSVNLESWMQPDTCVTLRQHNKPLYDWPNGLSGGSRLKPNTCKRKASITNPVKICGNMLCIIALVEICHREASMTFLA
ncbi:hypothetical protein NDA11_002039 [Ustilago hordei]|uniref:Uncharacterized protein n=1 Tax=Ustilago hordei TaxID=120017 RepID=I2FS75_USTHO|nr:uncharacterized protein UHO2_05825 [Ustilago hordei]KAJ1573246.1 hypothetical protein NDA15_002518 [Ustilago hordei]KAJ1574712.1 hypothetical protein NDA12_002066 [Ustilago hordei]KAJ1576606.1 hypothetical protein NDA11_002039 [Ustilago hordei]KAJ1596309.1 hypothetical protein NDA14_003743 [Ustilago hordei]UTT88820.1 hypothetical protein NDA17_006688 [Ustilago hordei]